MFALDVFNFKMKSNGILQPGEVPRVNTSMDIEDISLNEQNAQMLKDLEIVMPCDVNNPLLGPNGAAYVFGPQKGAVPSDL